MISDSGNHAYLKFLCLKSNVAPQWEVQRLIYCVYCLDRHDLVIDHETTKFSHYINSTFGNMTLSQALNEIVSVFLCKAVIYSQVISKQLVDYLPRNAALPFSAFMKMVLLLLCRRTAHLHGNKKSWMPCQKTSLGIQNAATFMFLHTQP